MSRPTMLYRFFDSQHTLLYVGISSNGTKRWSDHKASKPWWTQVATATLQHFEDRQTALAAEKSAIKQERPVWNIAHNERIPSGHVDVMGAAYLLSTSTSEILRLIDEGYLQLVNLNGRRLIAVKALDRYIAQHDLLFIGLLEERAKEMVDSARWCPQCYSERREKKNINIISCTVVFCGHPWHEHDGETKD